MLISDLSLGEGRLLERGRLIERSVLVSVTIGQKLKDQITRIKELCEHMEKERTQSDLTEWKVFSCTDSDVFLSLRNTHSDNKYKRGNRTKKKKKKVEFLQFFEKPTHIKRICYAQSIS